MPPIRFNARELSLIAQKSSQCFDREGILRVKEKQEGLFRKGEMYVDRLFRLRGNLLFYFKTKDPHSEVLGVYVLERCMVQLSMEEEADRLFSFVIMFEGEDRGLELSARTEKERAGWIEVLHIASYECMQMQLQSLREQLRSRTGRDPIEEQNQSNGSFNSASTIGQGPPSLEFSLACEGLSSEPSTSTNAGKQPDTFVSVHYCTPQKQHWFPLSHTELVTKCSMPRYLTTVGVYSSNLLAQDTKFKLMVYDVKERMTATMAQIGSAVFTMEEMAKAPNATLRKRLESLDPKDSGTIIVKAWSHPAPTSSGDAGRRLDIIDRFYDNMQCKTYLFPTNVGTEIFVHEYLAESKFCYQFPVTLLRLWIEEEKSMIGQLQELGDLTNALDDTKRQLLDYHMSLISTYTQSVKYLSTYQGAPFKPSYKKGHKEVEFAPTNLHLQRLYVKNSHRQREQFYDITTVGGFTAFAHKYKNGGLRRLLTQFHEQIGLTYIPGSQKIFNPSSHLNTIGGLLTASLSACESLCRAALQGTAATLGAACHTLRDTTRKLIHSCGAELIEEAVQEHADTRRESSPHHLSPAVERQLEAAGSWKWSGTDFVKSPTEEPWELTRLNTEAALVCVVSLVEDLVREEAEAGSAQWLAQLSPLVIKLKSCIQVMCHRARSGLTFLAVKQCHGHVPLMHTIKYRRDVCFSQALTAATSAFVTHLCGKVKDQRFLQQLLQLGVLLEFEGLISCYSSEMGMIEDMAVAVQDLSTVAFKLVQKASTSDLPSVHSTNEVRVNWFPDMSRTSYIVHIPLEEEEFSSLPEEFQKGNLIRVTSVFFDIGINEQATLAEKIGDLTVQEEVNLENYRKLSSYYSVFKEYSKEQKLQLPVDLEQMVRLLHVQIVSKKSKNVEALHLAAEICRYMNGVRFTSCKSAKDRTAMSATLEQIQLLLKEHELATYVYIHALDCMRSEGLRRENASKNTGSRKYAFNSIQLLSFPKLYRPPSGTYGNIET